jgi:hypothetical protein
MSDVNSGAATAATSGSQPLSIVDERERAPEKD